MLKWQIDKEIFYSKLSALEKSKELKKRPTFVLDNNKIWQSFVPKEINLDELYLKRAEMLREKYKKIKIFFSGGSDSHNILMTFLKNKIHVDEVVIRWPSIAIDGKFHHHNKLTNNPKNYLFEYDFAILPVLNYLNKNFPKIKITIDDYTTSNLNDISNFTVDNFLNLLDQHKFMRGTMGSMLQRIGRKNTYYDGDNVANIFGVEKPILLYIDQKYYFVFNDLSFEMFTGHLDGTPEPFYWTVDLPELPISQAYVLAKFYKLNPNLNSYLLESLYSKDGKYKIDMQNKISKKILYRYWDENTFQVEKPNFYRDDWYGWLEKILPIDELKLNENFTKAVNIYYSDCIGSKGLMTPTITDEKKRPYLPTAIFSELFEIKI